MINKFLITIIISVSLTNCGFSPIYTGNSKQVIISKSEIVGDKDLAFNLEQKLNFKKDEKNLNAYIFKAQIYDTAESSIVDSRGISTEEIAASFAAARAIGDEDEDIIKTLPKDAPKSKMTISDEDYDKLMKFLNAKERLRNIDSALRQNKKISRGGDDMISKDTGEEARLKAKKAELEKRIDDLVASSEYLQRRKAPEDKNK